MKISVCGSIIDTEQIYEITEVFGDNCWGEETLNHSGFGFEIKFLNNQVKIVGLRGNELYNDEGGLGWWKNGYEEKIKAIEDAVRDMREKIVKTWLENQPKIPMFEFHPIIDTEDDKKITKDECDERERLMNLRSDPNRWFTREEFIRLQYLSMKFAKYAGKYDEI